MFFLGWFVLCCTCVVSACHAMRPTPKPERGASRAPGAEINPLSPRV
jgi:hypothetical protein